MSKQTKTCLANTGTRQQPRPCGQPVAPGMHAACEDHKTAMIPVPKHPGIYTRGGSHVAVTVRHGKQHKSYHRTLAEAREAKSDRTGNRQAGRPRELRQPFDTYALAWIDNYQGRGDRGFDEDTRASYKRALEAYAIPHFRSKRLSDIDRDDVNALVAKMQRQGLCPRQHPDVHGSPSAGSSACWSPIPSCR